MRQCRFLWVALTASAAGFGPSFASAADAVDFTREIKPLLEDYDAADEAHLYNKYGLVRDGKWKMYQLITYSFIHANSRIFGLIFPLHLFFNLITLFAVGFSVEDLWGRDLFLLFRCALVHPGTPLNKYFRMAYRIVEKHVEHQERPEDHGAR